MSTLQERRLQHLEGLSLLGVASFDLAVSFWRLKCGGDRASKNGWERPDGYWRYRENLTLEQLTAPTLTAWLSLANTERRRDDDRERGAEVYIRPARTGRWPAIFLDDVTTEAVTYLLHLQWRCLVVATSPDSHHVWIATNRPLDQHERYAVQRRTVTQLNAKFSTAAADPGSVSGEHLGRFAGFCNRKPWRDPAWVNLIHFPASSGRAIEWDAATHHIVHEPREPQRATSPASERATQGAIDRSQSGREYGFVLRKLYFGDLTPDQAVAHLRGRAETIDAQGPNLRHYAERTVQRAQAALARGEVPYGCKPRR